MENDRGIQFSWLVIGFCGGYFQRCGIFELIAERLLAFNKESSPRSWEISSNKDLLT